MNQMKRMRYLWLPVASACLMLSSCAEDYKETIPMPDKPVDVALAERLSSYDVLSEYASAKGIKAGVSVDPTAFASQGLLYSIVVSNFNQVESSSKFTHLSFLSADNVLDFTPLSTLKDAAGKAGVEMFGPALCSDVNIPDDYLKSLIADVVIPYQPWSEDILVNDFENDEVGKKYPSVKKAVGSVDVAVMDDPLGVRGKVLGGTSLTMDLPKLVDIKLPDGFTLADVSRVKLKCLVLSGTPTSSRIVVESAGLNESGNPFKTKNQWEDYVFDLTKVKLSDAERARNTFSIAVGAYGSKVSCCIDDVTIQLEHSTGDDTVIKKTPEEKTEIIKGELYKWVDGVLDVCGTDVKEYVIFDEPLDSEVASFHWSEYLGDRYVADVQKAAEAKAGADVKFYVSQSLVLDEMLANDVRSLKSEIEALESKGVRVDAVNLVINASYSLDYVAQTAAEATVKEALKSLSLLGKPVRVAGFKVKVVDENGMQVNPVNMTTEQRQAVAEYYELVFRTYLETLADKALGISLSSAMDTTQETAPWLQNGNRSFVYEGIVKGLTN